MIPLLTIDEESVRKNWDNNEEFIKDVMDFCNVIITKNKSIPVYLCDDNWVNMEVFKECKKTYHTSDFFEFGYCDTEDALEKYLQSYVDDKENSYFVQITGMSIDYEKYYKNGSYINKDGIDTGVDYYEYIDEHPDMKVDQDIEGTWIQFTIYKLKF